MLTEQQMLDVLRQAPIFSLMAPDSAELCVISRAAREVHFPAREVLFREGDNGDCLYLLVSGRVRLLKENTPLICLSGAGTPIGELALITNEQRSATVETLEPSCFLQIDRESFFQALEQDASIARGVFSALNHKLRDNLVDKMQVERREIARRESLRMAGEVQRSLLPAKEVQVSGLHTAGYCQPADVVGGDYYDYLALPDGRQALFMADVMDHGLHSAMLMAMLKSGLHAKIEHDASVNGVLHAVHRIADEQVGIFIYLTCCYLVFEPAVGVVEYANAGNPPMLLYRAASGEIEELSSRYAPLGLLPAGTDSDYLGKRADWRPGDVLLVYSDGVTDAQNAHHDSFGPERLRSCLQASAGLPAMQIRQRILEDLRAFAQGVPGRDDVTLVVAKAEY